METVRDQHLHLPDFVQERVNSFLHRLHQDWGGDHLLLGPPRSPGDVALMSNDYLDLLNERSLRERQAAAMLEVDQEVVMSATFIHGDTPLGRLEQRLASFVDAEDGILCQSGYAANVGLIQALAGPKVPVYLDAMAHASLWEGARSAGARALRFSHNDAEQARARVTEGGPGVIAVDSVYSTDGSVAPLKAFVALAKESGSVLVVDESHSLGTHGPSGSGMVCGLGLAEAVPFRTVSLAKAFAGRAGFIACPTGFKVYFNSESRPAIFSSGLLTHELVWLEEALRFIVTADDRRERLHQIARTVRCELDRLGYNVSDGSEQIISLEAGLEHQTLCLRNALQRRGIFGSPFCAPATAKNRSLIRFSLNSGLTDDDIARLLAACAEMREEVGLNEWASTRRSHGPTAFRRWLDGSEEP